METMDALSPQPPVLSPSKAGIRYGAYIAFILLTLIPVISGIRNDAMWLRILNFVITVGSIVWMTTDYKRKFNHGRLTVGQGTLLSFIAGLVNGAIISLFIYILYTYISPGMLDAIKTTAIENMQSKGLSNDQIKASLEITGFMFKPAMIAVMGFFGTPIMFTILGLIVSAIVKKD
jgi:Protein of unknown function (DUF4199)